MHSDIPIVRSGKRTVATFIVGVFLASSCGSGEEPEVLASQSSETEAPVSQTSTSQSSGGLQAEAEPGTTTETRPSSTSTTSDGLRSSTGDNDPTTTAVETSEVVLPEGSEEFLDLEGQWLMSVDPSWNSSHGTIQDGVELWFLPDSSGGFADNVNVLTQDNLLGVGIERYLDISLASAESVFEDFELLDDRFLTGSHGQQQGLLEYKATLEGIRLHFFQILVLDDDLAVVATMAAPVDRFADRRDEIAEYMRTLRLVGSSS